MARGVTLVTAAPKVGRKMRSPRHSFTLRQSPWEIQPFMIAPVLPGETLKNALIQARVESPLVTSSRIGWWYEQYFFYVKHRDLMASNGDDKGLQMMEMHLGTPLADIAATDLSSKMTVAGQGNYVGQALNAIVHHYFRSEGESINIELGPNGLPLSSILQNSWMDSLKGDDSVIPVPDDELPGMYPVLPDHVDPAFAPHFAQWEQMRAMGIYTADFGDYLKTFGVTVPRELRKDVEVLRPELLRYIKDWKYPQPSMVGETTGFQVRWDIAERIDKDRHFAEPGFIVGVTVCRPKVYYARQLGNMAGWLTNAYSWVPAVLHDQAYTSLIKFLAGTGPVKGATDDYWVDARDLFMHGDQYMNFNPLDGTGANINEAAGFANLPTADLKRRYIPAGDARDQFIDPTKWIEVDGVVTLDILSRIEDTSGHGSEN